MSLTTFCVWGAGGGCLKGDGKARFKPDMNLPKLRAGLTVSSVDRLYRDTPPCIIVCSLHWTIVVPLPAAAV